MCFPKKIIAKNGQVVKGTPCAFFEKSSKKFLTFFVPPKKNQVHDSNNYSYPPPYIPFPTDAFQDFLMFLRRSEFYMTIRVSHVFLLIFREVWGRSFPEMFGGF